MTPATDLAEETDRENNSNRLRIIWREKIAPFIFKQFLMIGVLIAILVGFVLPQPGAWVGSFKGSSYICVICIFLHSGLKLKTAEMKDVLKEYKGFLWGFLSIVLVTSLLGTRLTQLLPFGDSASHDDHGNRNTTVAPKKSSVVGPREFLLALELYYISPCAVASGIVLTSLAGGDITLAVLLTVTTNVLGVVTVPLLAKWLVSVKDVQINVVNLLIKLLSTVLAPLLIGKLMTFSKLVRKIVRDYGKTLKLISVVFLVCIPWMKISKAKLDGSFGDISVLSLFIMLLWGFALHLAMIIVNFLVAWLIRVNLPARKTLVILASTKTLAITLSVISFLPSEFADGGLMSLPLIVIHLGLLLVDSAWVVHWNTTDKNQEVDSEESGRKVEDENQVNLLQNGCNLEMRGNHVTSMND